MPDDHSPLDVPLKPIFLDDRVQRLLVPDTSLDIANQIEEIRTFVTEPVGSEITGISEPVTAFPYFEGVLLDQANGGLGGVLNVLDEVLPSFDKGSYINDIRIRSRGQSTQSDSPFSVQSVIAAEDTVSLIYNPKSFVRQFLPNIKFIQPLKEEPLIQNMQRALLTTLVKEHEEFLAISRATSYSWNVSHDELNLPVQQIFYKDKRMNKEDEDLALYRYFFGLLACHVGYSKKPPLGNWEHLVSKEISRRIEINSLEVEGDIENDLLHLERTVQTYTPEELAGEKAISNIVSGVVSGIFAVNYMNVKSDLGIAEQSLRSSEKANWERKYRELDDKYQKLKKRNQDTKAERKRQLDTAVEKAQKETRKAVEGEYEERLAEYRDSARQANELTNQLRDANHLNEKLSGRVAEREAEIEGLEGRLSDQNEALTHARHEIARLTKQTPYKVDYHESFAPKKKYEGLVQTAKTTLEQDVNGRVLKGIVKKLRGGLGDHYQTLFPSLNAIGVYRSGDNMRLVYGVDGNKVIFLELIDHQKYDRINNPAKKVGNGK